MDAQPKTEERKARIHYLNSQYLWRQYEIRKAEIQRRNLSPSEYEKAIDQLTKELGI